MVHNICTHLKNNVMLNIYKTLYTFFKQFINSINCSIVTSIFPPVIVDEQIITPNNSVKKHGIMFVNKLSFIDQISIVCLSSFLNLHTIKTIRQLFN